MAGAQGLNVHGVTSCSCPKVTRLHSKLDGKFKHGGTFAARNRALRGFGGVMALDEGGGTFAICKPETKKKRAPRMGQIQDLEQRLTAAFGRISASAAALSASPAAPADEPEAVRDLEEALAKEQASNADLAERLTAQQDAARETEEGLRTEVDTLTRQLDAQGLDIQRLSGTMAQLREDLRRLREASEAQVVEPALINRALQSELEALRITRAAEVTEMNDILLALTPIIEAEEARAHA